MPSAEKQKKQAALRGKTKKQRARQTRRSEGHSNLAFELFMRDAPGTEDYFLAKVIGKMGAGRFTVQDDAGKVYPSIPIKGSLKLKGRATHNAGVATAIGTGTYVLMDARVVERVENGKKVELIDGMIHAVLSTKEAKQARAKLGAGSPKSTSSRRSKASSASTVFNYDSNSSSSANSSSSSSSSANNIVKKMAERKAKHKHTRKANKALNAAVNAAVNVAVNVAGADNSEVLLVAGKKVYDAAGEKLHGEKLREAKRELAVAVKSKVK